MKFLNLASWLSYIESIHPQEIELGLDRVREVAKRLNVLNQSSVIIIVGGTNGKGSSVAALEKIYLTQGFEVGSFSSPYLIRINEEIKLNGMEATDAQFCAAFEKIDTARRDIQLTTFEFKTLAALEIFSKAKLDVIILEVGLGGRFDAVNIMDADVAVITSISLDHMDRLGNTRELIGFEKAGICRPGKPVVCGDVDPPQSLARFARECDAVLFCQIDPKILRQRAPQDDRIPETWLAGGHTTLCPPYVPTKPQEDEMLDSTVVGGHATLCPPYETRLSAGSSFTFYENKEKNTWGWKSAATHFEDLPMPALALQNMSTVLKTIELLQEKLPVTREAIDIALRNLSLTGRIEIVPGQVTQIFDVSHNPAGAQLLANKIKNFRCDGKTIAVFSMLTDKDIHSTLEVMKEVISEWNIAALDVKRGATLEKLCESFKELNIKTIKTFSSISEAYQNACNTAKTGDRIIVFGSFYTVAGVRTSQCYLNNELSLS